MSDACLHCAILAAISDHADAKTPAGSASRVDVGEAMFSLGAVFRNIMSMVPPDRQAEVAQAFASGTNAALSQPGSSTGLH